MTCAHKIYYRDKVLRYTGTTKSGFERQMTYRFCKNAATIGSYCRRHAPKGEKETPR